MSRYHRENPDQPSRHDWFEGAIGPTASKTIITIKWVDDIGTKTGIAEINGQKRLLFEDTDGQWRNVGQADSRVEDYHKQLIFEGAEHGTFQIHLRPVS